MNGKHHLPGQSEQLCRGSDFDLYSSRLKVNKVCTLRPLMQSSPSRLVSSHRTVPGSRAGSGAREAGNRDGPWVISIQCDWRGQSPAFVDIDFASFMLVLPVFLPVRNRRKRYNQIRIFQYVGLLKKQAETEQPNEIRIFEMLGNPVES